MWNKAVSVNRRDGEEVKPVMGIRYQTLMRLTKQSRSRGGSSAVFSFSTSLKTIPGSDKSLLDPITFENVQICVGLDDTSQITCVWVQPFKQHLLANECELNPGRKRAPHSDAHLSEPLQPEQKRTRLHGCLLCFRRKSRELRQARLCPQDASAQPSSNRYRTNWPYFLLQSLTHKFCSESSSKQEFFLLLHIWP